MGTLSTDKQANKIAVCSAVFAGFAYVGYSVVRNAFTGRGVGLSSRRMKAIEEEQDERNGKERVFLRRLSQTTQTDGMLGHLEMSTSGGRIVIRPMSVQQRIKELNVRAHQFADAVLAIQHVPTKHTRNVPRSLQVSPWGSPRVLSPVDFPLSNCKSNEDLTESPKQRRLSRKVDFGSMEKLKPVEEDSDSIDSPSLSEDMSSAGRVLSKDEARNLVKLLRLRDRETLIKVLTTISNCSAFSASQNILREVGCLQRLEPVLLHPDVDVKIAVANAIGNLALNEENQKELKGITAVLTNLVQCHLNDRLMCSLLSALMNIAALPNWHREIVPCVSRLYSLIEGHSSEVEIQVLRLLVNLACNDDVVPHLLAAEAPKRLLHQLDLHTPESVLLRLTSFLANVTCAARRLKVTYADLPVEVKAPAPDTMFTALFGNSFQERMRVKALALSEAHGSGEVRYQASRLAEALSG